MWPVEQTDGSRRVTVEYRGVDDVIPPLHAAVPDTITLIDRVRKVPGDRYAVVDLAGACFTVPIDSKFWAQFALTRNGR